MILEADNKITLIYIFLSWSQKFLLWKHLLLLYFEGVNLSLVMQWKQWTRELNFNGVKTLFCFSRKRKFSMFLEIPVEDSLNEQKMFRHKISKFYLIISTTQKQPPRRFPWKRCFENMQQIYRRTPMPKCDFSKVAM